MGSWMLEFWEKEGKSMNVMTDQIACSIIAIKCVQAHTHMCACTHNLTSLLKCIKQPEAGAPINSSV